MAEATAALATLINAQDPDELVIGPSTSMQLKILSLCLSWNFEPGDEIIVTQADHEANVSPWMALKEKGMVIKVWPLDPETFALDIATLEKMMTPRTRLVAFPHVSNVLGTIHPVRDICDVVHRHGALTCVDGVAYAPHRAIDVQAMDVDFYAFSFYKVYGPHQALLYGRKTLLEALPGFNHYFIRSTPYKLQPGNVNYELAYGMLGLMDYLKRLVVHHHHHIGLNDREVVVKAFELFAEHEQVLAARFLEWLTSQPKVRIIGNHRADETRVPTISFIVEGKNSDEITRAVDPHGIGIRYGDFYAKKAIEALGLEACNGVVRVSMVHYNTLDEVQRLITVLEQALS